MLRRFGLIMTTLLSGLAWTACGEGYGPSKPATPAAPAGPGEVALVASYPSFKPSTIDLVKGRAVKLKVTSRDIRHTFTVDELGINVQVSGGQTVTQEIRLDRSGTFTFYCAVPGHRNAGMQGTLRVTE